MSAGLRPTLPPGVLAFRCDGDDRLGAGHVARCLQIALAFEAAGVETVFVGTYSGIAARLLTTAGARTVGPGSRVAGVPEDAVAAVVDSYEIPVAEAEALAAELPTALIADGAGASVTAVLSYHLDAPERCAVPEGTTPVLGPDYAPVRPACITARRNREFEHLLVTVGGGTAGLHLVDEVVAAALDFSQLVLFVVGEGASVPPASKARVRQEVVEGGLVTQMAWADVAVTTAGSTPYELACAGVPSLLIAIADNQAATLGGFLSSGLAHGLDARSGGSFADRLRVALERLAWPAERAACAAAGPALIDGYGAFRARDALAAAFSGEPLPRVLRYRPVEADDMATLLEWRNDPEVRAASRSSGTISPQKHMRWFERTLADSTRTLLVVEEDGRGVGTVRFDAENEEAEISVTIAPGNRGGTGSQAIAEASELYLAAHPATRRIRAEVRHGNERSRRAFARAGYQPSGDTPVGGILLLGR